MRRLLSVVSLALVLLLLPSSALGGPIEEAADKVLLAIKKGDLAALKALADDTVVDPWLVSEELCVRGEHDAAARLATISPRRDLEKLPAYIESRRGKPRDGPAVEALDRAKPLMREKKWTEVLEVLRGVEPDGKTIVTVSVFVFRAMALRELQRFAESGRAWDRVGESTEVLGWSVRTSWGWHNAGVDHMAARDFGSAEKSFERNGRSEEWRGNRIGVASSIMNVALCRDSLGDAVAAKAGMERALKIQEEVGDLGEQSRCVMNIGNLLVRAGELDRALEHFERARGLAVRAKLPDIEAGCISNSGRVHALRGDLPRSLADKERAVEAYERLGMKPELSIALMNLGLHRQAVGNYKSALDCLERAHAISSEAGDMRNVPLLYNLSTVNTALGRAEQATDFLDRAIEAAREIGERYGLAICLGSRCDDLANAGRLEEARKAGEESLAIRRELGDRMGVAYALGSLAFVEEKSAKYEEGIARRAEALAVAREVGSVDLEVRCLWAVAESNLHLGRAGEAAARAREAVERLGDLVGGLGDVEAASIRERWSGLYSIGLAAAIDANSAELVAYFLESGRAGALLELLGDRERLSAAVLPPPLLEVVAEARRKEVYARETLREATQRGSLAPIVSARKALDVALRGSREAIDRVQREAKSAAAVLYPRAASLRELQESLRAGEAMVLYGSSRGECVALVVTASQARVARLGPEKAVSEATAAMEAAGPKEGADPTAEALSRLVVTPLALEAGIRRLLVSPSEALSFVPLSAVIPDRELVFVASGSTYRQLSAAPGRGSGAVLALGDPDYAGAGTGTARAGPALTPLPATRAEAKAVGTEVLLGGEASEAGLRARLATGSKWRAVHLACHGLADADEPMNSALALASGGEHDGMLSVLDVYGLRVDAELVVLSACDTARGRGVKGEGVLGFPRAFLLSGARSVLVSLWKVDDEATRALMEAFYRRWNPPGGKGLSVAESLRAAQDEVRRQERWRHRSFWAAWQVWGRGD